MRCVIENVIAGGQRWGIIRKVFRGGIKQHAMLIFICYSLLNEQLRDSPLRPQLDGFNNLILWEDYEIQDGYWIHREVV